MYQKIKSYIGINVHSINIIVHLLIFHSVFQAPQTEHWLVSEEDHGWNEVSNATQPWCQHDEYGENIVNKTEKDGKQTKK